MDHTLPADPFTTQTLLMQNSGGSSRSRRGVFAPATFSACLMALTTQLAAFAAGVQSEEGCSPECTVLVEVNVHPRSYG